MARSAFLAMLGLATVPTNAFFLMPCWPVSTQRLDPIVDPGDISSHVHQIAGGGGFAPAMNYSGTQAADCTTCFVNKDKSNYWIPALYYRAQDGSFERVEQDGSASMYYFNEKTRLGPGETMEPFPKGLRMLAGDPDKRSGGTDFASQALNFKCLNYAGTPTDSKTFPPGNCPDGVRAEVTFPSCWDGKNLDSADHKSHMAYPTLDFENGACPSTHPHHVVVMKVEFIFDTNKFAGRWYGDSQPFVWSTGDPTGYGLHADYLMGWDYDLLSSAIEQCFDEFGVLENCAPFADYLQTAYVNPGTCAVDSFVDENIGGTLDTLPGCNAVQAGPANAVKQTCNDPVKLKGAWANDWTDGLLSWLHVDGGSSESAPAASASASSPSAKPNAFYSQSAVVANVASSIATPAPVPTSAEPSGVKVVTVTDIVTETTYTTETPAAPVAAASSSAPAAWGKWSRGIGDDMHKQQHRHIRRGGRRTQ